MYQYNVIIKKIIDGDSVKVDIDLGFDVWLKDENVRLFGIDAPEFRTTDLVEKKFGLLSKEFVEKMLPVGSKQYMFSAEFKRGKFGRILADFVLNDTTLTKLLVDNRLAVVYNNTTNRKSLIEDHIANREYLEGSGILDGENKA